MMRECMPEVETKEPLMWAGRLLFLSQTYFAPTPPLLALMVSVSAMPTNTSFLFLGSGGGGDATPSHLLLGPSLSSTVSERRSMIHSRASTR